MEYCRICDKFKLHELAKQLADTPDLVESIYQDLIEEADICRDCREDEFGNLYANED
jgi:hypothetical protein